MSQLTLFLALVLTVVVASGFSVDSPHIRGGQAMRGGQKWRGQQGQGSVSQVRHTGASNRFTSKQNTAEESQQPQNPKPPASICQAAGFFSNPGSCTGFHRCVDWTGRGTRFSIFHFTCPVGTIFDNGLSICNHPWAVARPECTGYQEPLVVMTTQEPTQTWTPSHSTPTQATVRPTQSWTDDTTPSTITPVTGTNGSSISGPPKPFTLECRQDNTYRRHPIYCNRYYYCYWDNDAADWTFPSFTCPMDLIFDEYSQQCSASGTPCDGILAPTDAIHSITSSPTPSVTPGPDALNTTDSMDIVTWVPDPVSSYSCPAPGYYPFEGDCIRFYKCVETEEGKLKGLLYRCPNGYGYNEQMQRCRKELELPKCTRFMANALFRVEAARPLYVEDLKWFFVN